MKKINLRDYYPFYKKDAFVEATEEIALLLREYELLEEAYRIHLCDLVEQLYDREQLYKGLASLPEKQRTRIYAYYFLGISKSAIARAENVNESNVR